MPGSVEDFRLYALLHETGHISDPSTRTLFSKVFGILGPIGTLSSEAFADVFAINAGKEIGLNSDFLQSVKDWRAINTYMDDDHSHATSVFLDNPPGRTANGYYEDAEKFHGESRKAKIFSLSSVFNETNKSDMAELYNDLDDFIRQKTKFLESDKNLASISLKATMLAYMSTRASLNKNIIRDPEQQAYARDFCQAIERRLDKSLLNYAAERLVPAAEASISASDRIYTSQLATPIQHSGIGLHS